MYLEIITPVKKVYEGEVKIVTCPGVDGSFQVLNDHTPMISSLQSGEVEYKTEKGETLATEITGGVIEILNNKVVLLADGLKD